MNQPFVVGVVQGFRQISHQRRSLAQVEPPLLEQVSERRAFDEVRNDHRQALQRRYLVNGHDTGMTQQGDLSSLITDPL